MIPPLGTWPSIHALRHPDDPALIDGATGAVVSYADLEARTSRLASALRNRGIAAGDRVAVLSLNSPQMLETFIALAKLGAITVMVNTRLTPPEVHYILKDSGATHMFASTVLMPVAEAGAEGTPIDAPISLSMAAERRAGARSGFDELVEAGSEEIEFAEVDPDSPIALMYTSGTTGNPKGAIITHANLFWVSIYHNAFESGLNRNDVTLVSAPLFHIGALAAYTVPNLYWGGSSVIQESFDAADWLDLVEEHRVTKAFAVPTMWTAIASSGGLETHDVSSLDVAITGGAPCPLPIIEKLQSAGMRFTEGFGLTETTAMASALPASHVAEKLGSIGIPAHHVEFTIVDPLGEEVPTGVVGELLVRGPSVSPGYWNRPDADAEAHRDGWFHTGDLATVDEDGFYRIVGRKKDMVISGGENVYPIEVEQVLYEHPAIAEVAVVGAPDEKWGETVAAAIVLTPTETRDREELISDIRGFAEQRLAGFKLPRRFDFVDELPRTATGKVRKVEIRSSFSST